jgi:hypothetical protein
MSLIDLPGRLRYSWFYNTRMNRDFALSFVRKDGDPGGIRIRVAGMKTLSPNR